MRGLFPRIFLFLGVLGGLVGAGWVWRDRAGAVGDWYTSPQVLSQDRELLAQAMDAVGWGAQEGGPGALPDIVVVVLDTVRADRLGSYNPDHSRTPGLDAWATGARVFERATANGPWTLPSHGSLFTGLSPGEHGARGVMLKQGVASALNPDVPTVAQLLADRGYKTAGIAANRAFLDRQWGLSRGFGVYLCEELPEENGLSYTTGDRVVALGEQFLRDASGPRFLFLNLMDAHSPYVLRTGLVAHPWDIRASILPGKYGFIRESEKLMADRVVDPVVTRAWEEGYDAGVRYLDQQVTGFLSRLSSLGVGPEDLVVVLSDHGEYLGEHFLVEHSKDVYEEVLHIPLLVRGPGFAVGVDGRRVQPSDVAGWLLRAAGIMPDFEAIGGENLAVAEAFWARRKDLRNPRYGKRFNRVRRAFYEGDKKVLLGSDGSFEAYDLAIDPHETHDRSSEPWAQALKERGFAWEVAHPPGGVTPPSAEESNNNLEALKALGYVDE